MVTMNIGLYAATFFAAYYGFLMEQRRKHVALMDTDALEKDFNAWLGTMGSELSAQEPQRALELARGQRAIMTGAPLFGGACVLLVLALTFVDGNVFSIGLLLSTVAALYMGVQGIRYWRVRLKRFEQLIIERIPRDSAQLKSTGPSQLLHSVTARPPDPASGMAVLMGTLTLFALGASIVGLSVAARVLPILLLIALSAEGTLVYRQRTATKEDWRKRLEVARLKTFLEDAGRAKTSAGKRTVWPYYLAPLLIFLPFMSFTEVFWPVVLQNITIVIMDILLITTICVAAVNLIIIDLNELDKIEGNA